MGYSPWGRKELDMTEQLHSLCVERLCGRKVKKAFQLILRNLAFCGEREDGKE